MTLTTPTTDRTRELLARARAAEDERDALARQVTSMQLKINRMQTGEPDSEASALLTRQLQRARADLVAAQETIAALQRQLGAAQRLLAAVTTDDAELERLQGAVEALTEQNRVLRLANRTLGGQA